MYPILVTVLHVVKLNTEWVIITDYWSLTLFHCFFSHVLFWQMQFRNKINAFKLDLGSTLTLWGSIFRELVRIHGQGDVRMATISRSYKDELPIYFYFINIVFFLLTFFLKLSKNEFATVYEHFGSKYAVNFYVISKKNIVE